MLNVLIIVGSSDINSHSLHLGQAIEKDLQTKGAQPTLVHLAELRLPLYDRGVERAKSWDDKTAEFLKISKEADAYVWITPVYHNSYSSIIKNALDWQHFFMDDKVVGMASNGGDRTSVAVDHLMMIARSQRMITSPIRTCTAEDDYDEELNITSEKIIKRIDDFGTKLLELATKLHV